MNHIRQRDFGTPPSVSSDLVSLTIDGVELRGDELVRMTPSKDGGANEGHA